MNDELFKREIDRWLSDVRDEVFRLHDSRVQSEACLQIAIQIATAKATKRAMDQQRLLGGGLPAGLTS